jgi:hypothetical protein
MVMALEAKDHAIPAPHFVGNKCTKCKQASGICLSMMPLACRWRVD